MVSRTHQGLIARLFPDDPISQKMAANFVDMYAPAIGDRVEGLLHEAAAVNAKVLAGEKTPEQARAYLGSFAQEAVGILPATVADGLKFLEGGAGLTAEDLAGTETPGAEPAEAQTASQAPPAALPQPTPAPSSSTPQPLADRHTLRQRMATLEAQMKEPPGSEGWRKYWKEGGEVEYRTALEQLDASTNALAGIAGTPAPAAAQRAAAPAQTPTAPTAGA
jgi:hypothetical protein